MLSKIICFSSNQKSLVNFVLTFKKAFITKKTNKVLSLPTKLKHLTILKSPHVNKSAQDQFQKQNSKVIITTQSNNPAATALFLKKAVMRAFPDIHVKATFICKQEKSTKKLLAKQYRPDLGRFEDKVNSNRDYLALCDIAGEIIKSRKT